MCRSKKGGEKNFKLSKELHEDNREVLGFFPYWLFPELKVSVRLTTELFAHT